MRHNYSYIGCFFEDLHGILEERNLSTGALDKVIQTPHVTFIYRPEVVEEELFGEEVKITVIGYGNNGENEGLRVELATSNPRLQEMIAEIAVPHITLSVSRRGEAVNTKDLEFAPVEPFELVGIFGAYRKDGEVILKP